QRFGQRHYQMCGNMAVLRSQYTVGVKIGRIKVTTFRAHESLGVVGRDRRVSRHLASVTEPRYVQQTYHGGAKCNGEVIREERSRRLRSSAIVASSLATCTSRRWWRKTRASTGCSYSRLISATTTGCWEWSSRAIS
ncbi:hypothetical protein PMAYCL1PPCAC_20580, partial [Pristionchus mayeri]